MNMHYEYGSVAEAYAHMRLMEEQANERVVEEQRQITWGSHFLRVLYTSPVVIFGHVWPEDDILLGEQRAGASLEEAETTLRTLRASHERGYRFGRCYSIVEPEGELGDTHISDCWPITEEEFLQAQNFRWETRKILAQHDWLADALIAFNNTRLKDENL